MAACNNTNNSNNTNTNTNNTNNKPPELQLLLQSASYGLQFYNNEFINYIKTNEKYMKLYDNKTKLLILKLKKIGNVKKIYDKFTITSKTIPLCLQKLIFNTHICVKLDIFHLIMCSNLGCGFNFSLYNYELYECNNEHENNDTKINQDTKINNEKNNEKDKQNDEQMYFIKYKKLVGNDNETSNSKSVLIFHGNRMFIYY